MSAVSDIAQMSALMAAFSERAGEWLAAREADSARQAADEADWTALL